MLIKRLLVIVGPLILALILRYSFLDLRFIIVPFILALFLFILILKNFIKEKFWSKDFLYLSVLPILLYVTTFSFLTIISSSLLRNIVIIVFALFIVSYLEVIFTFFYRPGIYKAFSLENLAGVFAIMIFFLLALNLNAYIIFLNLNLWLLSLILIITTSLILAQLLWINKIKSRLKYVYLLVINVIIVEFFWSLTYLPTNFYVNAIILSVIFYFVWGIFKNKLTNTLNKKLILHYLLISSILLILIIITSPWT